jgi:hypothetical protein
MPKKVGSLSTNRGGVRLRSCVLSWKRAMPRRGSEASAPVTRRIRLTSSARLQRDVTSSAGCACFSFGGGFESSSTNPATRPSEPKTAAITTPRSPIRTARVYAGSLPRMAGVRDRWSGNGPRGQATRGGQSVAATTTPKSGTKDKNYDLITVTHLCLEHVWRLDQYAQDAEREGDQKLATLFRRMQDHSRKGADECKRLLSERLGEEQES